MNSLFHLRSHFQAFNEIILLLTRYRHLTWEMTKREISDRYVGQFFGLFWAIGHPLILMGVYVFIFAIVFKVRIGGSRELPLDYTTYLLSGLIPWMAFQESMAKSAMVIVGSANLVKQVVFPIEILPVKGVIASFVTQLISTMILVIYVFFQHGTLLVTYSLLPVLFFFQLLAMIGVSYIFSSIGPYFRDLKDFIQVFTVIGVFLMPIFYLPAQVPALFRPLLYLNPFSYLVWCYQDVCYFGRFEHPWAWFVFMTGSLGIFYAGYRIFRKLKTMFGNVL
jgi:lipopolysaccharide transport system permease protein